MFRVAPYRGYGNGARALVMARVLRVERIAPPRADTRWWRNAVASLQRMEADPLPRARVMARHGGADHELVADDEGFIHAWLPLTAHATEHPWARVELTVLHAQAAAPSVAEVLVPSPHARFGVISDLDDSVLQSNVGSLWRAARLLVFENALTRLPFPGVAALYRALANVGENANPIFYVSSSPWNQYDVIDAFLAAQEIPAGPLLLRDWDMGRGLLRHRTHKRERIREVFATYSGLPFILIGDSTQDDPDIYAELVHEYPGRVLAVYIRNVNARADRAEAIGKLAVEVEKAGSTLVLAADTVAVAKHAAERGWIPRDMLGEIAGEKSRDTGAAPGKAPAPGAPPVR